MGSALEGSEELQAALRQAGTRGPAALEAALYAEGLQIFAASQAVVPVDTGILRGSGVVEAARDGSVLIGYGGPATPYALTVHEDLEARHKEGKTAKYLEAPFTSALQGMAQRLADRVRKGF